MSSVKKNLKGLWHILFFFFSMYLSHASLLVFRFHCRKKRGEKVIRSGGFFLVQLPPKKKSQQRMSQCVWQWLLLLENFFFLLAPPSSNLRFTYNVTHILSTLFHELIKRREKSFFLSFLPLWSRGDTAKI